MRPWLPLAALLAAVPLAQRAVGADEPVSRAEIDAAVERGVAHFLARQRADGSWAWRGRAEPRAGLDALVVYALLHSGVPPDHEAIGRALAQLGSEPLQRTYDVACLALALEAHDAHAHGAWMAEIAEWLLATQDGGWGYPSGADLSNTQYGALGLRAAARGGYSVPAGAWADLAAATVRYVRGDGFAYNPGNGSTGSMTAAGVGTLAICGEMLAGVDDVVWDAARAARARESGIAWLTRHFAVDRNPGRGGSPYYYLYGLERLAAFTGVTHFGPHDWYAEGAAFLVHAQAADGGWGAEPDSAFALLFLTRATSTPLTGPGRGPRERHETPARDGEGREPDVRLIAVGDSPLTLWISGWGPAARALEWPGEEGRGPRVLSVEWHVDGRLVALVAGDADRPAEHERFACQHAFRHGGSHAVRVRVRLASPPSGWRGASSVVALESPELTIEIADVVPQWLRDLASDPARNLVTGERVRLQASSVFEGDAGLPGTQRGESAIDNRLRTAWLADPEDPAPTLKLLFRRPVRADVVLFSHAQTTPVRPGWLARPVALEVRIDGKRHVVRMPPDERHKGRLELQRPQGVRSLEIRLPVSVPGTGCPATGLAEVELQLRER